MLVASSKKLRQAEFGDSVVNTIALPNKVNSLGPSDVLGCITEKGDNIRVGASKGTLSVCSPISSDILLSTVLPKY